MENNMEAHQKIKNRTAISLRNPITGDIAKEIAYLKKLAY
jgi:hypothetical protein